MKEAFCQGEPPGFWRIVRLLLGAARKRAIGRQKRQNELLRHRARSRSLNWSWLGWAAVILLMAVVHGIAALIVISAVSGAERVNIEQGKIVVSTTFLNDIRTSEIKTNADREANRSALYEPHFLEGAIQREAHRMAHDYGGSEEARAKSLRESIEKHGTHDLISEHKASPGLTALPNAGPLPAMLGSIALLWWGLMITFQGEGLELDLQRRRHPMWEWLFSHPIAPSAIFTAEMLSPIAANPIYCTAPLFAGILYGLVYGARVGIVATVIIGVPLAVAAAFLGKALEIAVTLRFPPRSRGALIGLMSWFGYASMMLLFFGAASIDKAAGAIAKFLQPLSAISWPWLGLFLGQSGASFSFFDGMLACWCLSAVIMAGSVWFTAWAAKQGLSGNFGKADAAPAPAKGARFGNKPLYRKEMLWFVRDRSAIVQTILVPLTLSCIQLFNMRGLLSHAQNEWNYLCGAGVFFGTYFLWILGPKSLASEGNALWIALSWPHGMEDLLKAKAWLWSLISSGVVLLVLLYAAFVFPGDSWKIALVGSGWYFFSRSMANKTVTLVRVPSSSGEPEKISRNRQLAASLGMLTFSIGILTQQWHIAIMGIVYSYVTAAAMWENFRARLPFLYDPWSEKLPTPPTLMHAMIAISILVEGGAVLTALALAVYGRESIATAQAVIYGFCAVAVSLGLSSFLSNRGIAASEVWHWPGRNRLEFSLPLSLVIGAASGLALGLLATGYIAALLHFPWAADIIHKSRAEMQKIPGLHASYAIMAVAFAPFAEEYLFRGLLFRALDREWGGWRAIIGSAAFFAVYHPLLAWPPVFIVGMANALLFKKTGQLAPAVALHMVYNIVAISN